jgi:hypothetical protein
MKTITDLRNDLLDVYEQTKNGTIELNVATELSNSAGKIIKTAALELAYNQFTGQPTKKIAFLDDVKVLKEKN